MVTEPVPLTLTLSLREREQRASRSTEPKGLDCNLRRVEFTLAPRERAGWGNKPLNRAPMPAGPYDFEPIKNSSLRLSRRSLVKPPNLSATICFPRAGFFRQTD